MVPFGEEYSGPQTGVAGCLNWHTAPGALFSKPPVPPSQPKPPLRSCLKSQSVNVPNRLVETEYDRSLPNRYVPTPPPVTRRSYHAAVDSYREGEPRDLTSRTPYRPYTPGHYEEETGMLADSLQPHPPGSHGAPKPPPGYANATQRSHRACHVTTKDSFLLDEARKDYERSLLEGFSRDRDLEARLYGFDPRGVESSRPFSAARNYRAATPGGRRPRTSVGVLNENWQDVHVTWHPDTVDAARSRSQHYGTHPGHFNEWRRQTTTVANRDSYVDEDGRVVKPRGSINRYHNPRDGYGYWKMSRFTKTAKPKIQTHWQPPRSESPPKVNMQVDCPDDSDMLVSFRVRSAKM